jgi:hypothetical protein
LSVDETRKAVLVKPKVTRDQLVKKLGGLKAVSSLEFNLMRRVLTVVSSP